MVSNKIASAISCIYVLKSCSAAIGLRPSELAVLEPFIHFDSIDMASISVCSTTERSTVAHFMIPVAISRAAFSNVGKSRSGRIIPVATCLYFTWRVNENTYVSFPKSFQMRLLIGIQVTRRKMVAV